MAKLKNDKLLKDKRVVDEIKRHLWIESEKVGHDIGYDKASVDWLENFSSSWMKYHLPSPTKRTGSSKTTIPSKAKTVKKTVAKKSVTAKKTGVMSKAKSSAKATTRRKSK